MSEPAVAPVSAEPTTPEVPLHRYTPERAGLIEQTWQDYWAEKGTFNAENPKGSWAPEHGELNPKKKFILDMFPYPSGAGLHVGHPLGYIGTDVFARFQRMTGHNVLHTLGYDAFGLPAEQYAVATGQHPRKTTAENIATMRQQLRRLGLGHDQRRAIETTDPKYVRWTQWMFLKMWDSWYDPSAGLAGKARPIAELIEQYADGRRAVPQGGNWADLTTSEQAALLEAHRLAYISHAPVNWCPGLGTVLSNEEVTNEGRSERGNFPVFNRELRQWMLRISAYADRLVDDLVPLDWPEPVKNMQRNWIGRSTGAFISFATPATASGIEVFTTRPDTIFGVTFLVLSPEHPEVGSITAQQWPDGVPQAWVAAAASPQQAVQEYQKQAAARSDQERLAQGKTGVFTGGFATHPITGGQVPIFIADYVLAGYGTGAIMAVPAQDDRDWDFATQFEIPIIRTVQPPQDWEGDAFTGSGPTINSQSAAISLNGLMQSEAKEAVINWLVANDCGRAAVTYRLRDWLFSRQRYWGEPFPMVYDENGTAHAVPEHLLPIELPEVPNYAPKTFDPEDAQSTPEPPLGRVPDWYSVQLDLGDGLKSYVRETNTMPNWAGSCWYFLRYLDPENNDEFVNPEIEKYWLGPQVEFSATDPGGVDLYVGGLEHAVLHLLYARFWHKVLFDLGLVSSSEPFRKYFNQGMIQAYAYRDARGQVVPADEVTEQGFEGGSSEYYWNGELVFREHGKMGKSLKNVVTPDEMYETYGADTFRVYEMAMGPLDVSRPWETRAVVGSLRFLQRVWRNIIDEKSGAVTVTELPPERELNQLVHRTIAAVTEHYTNLRFNTAVAKLIELNNALTPLPSLPREVAEKLTLMIAPMAPHIAEELWQRLGHQESLTYESFPVAEEEFLVEETVVCVVQIQGKVRERLDVSPQISEIDLEKLILENEKINDLLDGRPIKKLIIRAPKLVNIVPG